MVTTVSSSSSGTEAEYQQHLHVLSGMLAVAERAMSVRATAFEQDGEGFYVVPEALLQCAALAAKWLKEASSSSSDSDSVHHAEEDAVMKLRQLAVKAVAVVGQSMTPWQLVESLDLLTSEDLALTGQEVEQLLQSLSNVGSTSHGWVVADNVYLLRNLQKVGATPSRELLMAVAGQLKDVAAAVAKRSRAKKPETKARVVVPCSEGEALGLLQLLQEVAGEQRLLGTDVVGVLQSEAKWH